MQVLCSSPIFTTVLYTAAQSSHMTHTRSHSSLCFHRINFGHQGKCTLGTFSECTFFIEFLKSYWPFSPLYVILWRNSNFNSAEPVPGPEMNYNLNECAAYHLGCLESWAAAPSPLLWKGFFQGLSILRTNPDPDACWAYPNRQILGLSSPAGVGGREGRALWEVCNSKGCYCK